VGELKRHFRDRTWLVKPPRQVQETYLVVQRAIADLDGHLGRRPTLTEVGDYVGLSISDVTEALQAAGGRWAVSLDAPLPQHDHATLGATLAEDDADLAAAENSTVVDHMLGLLPPVEREVVTLSFFDGLSQAEIAFVLGTNQGAVSRVRRRALARLGALSRDEPAVA
jgi:RNA polymerase sigma-B factor